MMVSSNRVPGQLLPVGAKWWGNAGRPLTSMQGLGQTLTSEQAAALILNEGTDVPSAQSSVVVREGSPVPWPDAEARLELLSQVAEARLRDEGVSIPGFARVLVARARDHLEAAAADWPGPGSDAAVLGVEVAGEVSVTDRQGAAREVRFRADRVDRVGEALRLIDYKTGKAFGDQKGESSRRKALIDRIARGRNLQAAAYALGGAACGPHPAEGRYQFLEPGIPDHARTAAVPSEDAELTAAFAAAVGSVWAAWDAGSFFPRLVEGDKEPRVCQSCDVKEACVRGDSGARRRLERWLDAPVQSCLSAPERALRELWNLGRAGQGAP